MSKFPTIGLTLITIGGRQFLIPQLPAAFDALKKRLGVEEIPAVHVMAANLPLTGWVAIVEEEPSGCSLVPNLAYVSLEEIQAPPQQGSSGTWPPAPCALD